MQDSFIGVGLGLVLRLGYSTGGMDIPPLLVNKYTGLSLGLLINIFDILILLIQIPFSNVEEIPLWYYYCCDVYIYY